MPDEDERRRDLEETKRLLYVASTRARDRLYLSTILSDGKATFNRGSFGEVLPDGFTPVFEAAAEPKTDVVQWRAPTGCDHVLRVLSSAVAERHRDAAPADGGPDRTSPVYVDLSPRLAEEDVTRRAVTASVSLGADANGAG